MAGTIASTWECLVAPCDGCEVAAFIKRHPDTTTAQLKDIEDHARSIEGLHILQTTKAMELLSGRGCSSELGAALLNVRVASQADRCNTLTVIE